MTCDEQDETPLSIFVSEHKSDLIKEFIEDNQELYEEFMKQFGEDTHKFIGEGFAEYHYEIFGRFCQDKFSDYCDDEQTEISLSHYYNVGRFR